jgi:hypothetical protein
MFALRRRPRINDRGRRVAKIHLLEKDDQHVPMLRLTGKWLAKTGFDIGQLIEIEVKRNKLIIRIDRQPQVKTEVATA